MNPSPVHYSSATDLADAIRNRRLSSVEVVSAHLERLKALNPLLNSVIQFAEETALEQAQAADALVSRGDKAGPLHGVPFTCKDVFAIRDGARLRTADGMKEKLKDDNNGDRIDSEAIIRMRQAGAILIARTKATLWRDREEYYGFTNNPYDLTRDPGGSSGGEAATIAAGGSPLGLGSDSGGSLRSPAHCCGITTIRPSHGRVPRATDAAGYLDPRTVAGPMARSVADVALALAILNGYDWKDPLSIPTDLSDYRNVSVPRLKIAFHTDNGIATTTPGTAEVVRSAAQALSDVGAIVEEVTPPAYDEAWQITLDYWKDWETSGTMAEYFRFQARWDRYRLTLLGFMQSWDAILCPVESSPAAPRDSSSGPGATYTAPYSLVSLPAAVVRAGASDDGLPIGVQIVARPWQDPVALALARVIESTLGGWQPPPNLKV